MRHQHPKSRGRQLTIRTLGKAYGNLLFCKLPLRDTHIVGAEYGVSLHGRMMFQCQVWITSLQATGGEGVPGDPQTVQPVTAALSCLSELGSKVLQLNATRGLEKLSWRCPGSSLFAGQFSQYQKLHELWWLRANDDQPGKIGLWHNSGMDVIGELITFWLDSRPAPQEKTHAWYRNLTKTYDKGAS